MCVTLSDEESLLLLDTLLEKLDIVILVGSQILEIWENSGTILKTWFSGSQQVHPLWNRSTDFALADSKKFDKLFWCCAFVVYLFWLNVCLKWCKVLTELCLLMLEYRKINPNIKRSTYPAVVAWSVEHLLHKKCHLLVVDWILLGADNTKSPKYI